jgi:hypothetical protein
MIFDLWFFHQTTPPRQQIHGAFLNMDRIREDIRLRNRRFSEERSNLRKFWSKHSGVSDTAVLGQLLKGISIEKSYVQ